MSILPRISGRDVVAALTKVGYERDRQKGSHIVLRQASEPHRRIVVPDHKEEYLGRILGDVVSERALRKILIELSVYSRGAHENNIEANPRFFFFVFPLSIPTKHVQTQRPLLLPYPKVIAGLEKQFKLVSADAV